MRHLLVGIGAVGALMLSMTPTHALSAPRSGAEPSSAVAKADNKPAPAKRDDVPAPPMALLFGIGAIGLIWGRRLAANARKAKDQADPAE